MINKSPVESLWLRRDESNKKQPDLLDDEKKNKIPR
jgi:hypothetical protein